MIANTDEFKEELELVKSASVKLCNALDQSRCIRLCNTPNGIEKNVLRDILTAYEYEDDQETNTVKECVGFIVASDADPFLQFNESRERWREYLKVKGRQKMKVNNEGVYEYVNMVKYMMSSTGNSRLHRKQIRREFVVIEGEPISVSFARWQNTKQKPISKAYAEGLFSTIKPTDDQIKAFKGSTTEEFYMVTHPYESFKANITFIPPNSDEVVRKTVATTLPVVFITESNFSCSLNLNTVPEKRARRNDTRGKHLFSLDSYKIYEKLPKPKPKKKGKK